MTKQTSPQPTPGPWRIVDRTMHGGDKRTIEDAMGRQLAAAFHVAPIGSTNTNERDANARLLASAPDLLAFVERVAMLDVPDPYPAAFVLEARALLSQIRGDA